MKKNQYRIMNPRFHVRFQGGSTNMLSSTFTAAVQTAYLVWKHYRKYPTNLEVCFSTKNGVWQWRKVV
jgi:hypothetical protein